MKYKEGKTRLLEGLTLIEMTLALGMMAVIFAVLAPQIIGSRMRADAGIAYRGGQ